MNLPNALSLARIAFIPLIVFFLLYPGQNNRMAAAVVFAVLVLTDAVDGYVARRFGSVSTFGKYIDPLADKILVITVLLALVELRAVSSIPVMIIAAREFAVTAWRLSAAGNGVVIAADVLGKWKTAIQMLAVMLLILNWPYGELLLWASVVLTVWSGIEIIARTWNGVLR